MTSDLSHAPRTLLEEEMAFGIKRRERYAWTIAGGGTLIGLLGITAVVLVLPLKETEAFLTIVDKDTGVAERVVAVERAGIDQAEGIRQALLYAYVIDRETFDADATSDTVLAWMDAAHAEIEGEFLRNLEPGFLESLR